jgi:hypothetical protein
LLRGRKPSVFLLILFHFHAPGSGSAFLLRILFRIQDSKISAIPCVRWPEPVFKIKKFGKELTLFNRIHKHSFRGLVADTPTFLRVDSLLPYLPPYPTLFCSNYFHKESTLFEKLVPFHEYGTVSKERVDLDLQKGRIGRYLLQGSFT